MIAYASWTGTRTTLAALRAARWRLLMTPDTLRRCRGKTYPLWPDGASAPYALDNGAWGCHQRGISFDGGAFRWAVARIADRADWVVMPDSVGDAGKTFTMADEWYPALNALGKQILFAVQDGMTTEDVEPWVQLGLGLFVGGSTDWKIATMRGWAALAHRYGQICHVARVNTHRRLWLCQDAGVDSVDGSSVSRFPCTLNRLDQAMRQRSIMEDL